jgi:hypothetical protein
MDWLIFDEVGENLAHFLDLRLCERHKLLKHPLKVVYICGLDHFNKCPYVAGLSNEPKMAFAVIYRLGAFDDHIKTLEKTSPNIYYTTFENDRETLIDISSTAIRKQYRTSINIDSDTLSYPCVMKYYQKKFSSSN